MTEQLSPATRTASVRHDPLEESWTTVLSEVLGWRLRAENSPQDAAMWRQMRAALRRGISEHTEHYAYPYVLPLLGSVPLQQRQACLRLVACLAEFDSIGIHDTKQHGRRSFGQWCAMVSKELAAKRGVRAAVDPTDPDLVASRLMYLHTLPFEQAVAAVRRLLALGQATSQAPDFDYWSLGSLLVYWGQGISPQSVRHRRQPLVDYYSHLA